jgi:hypothetical protein
MFLRPGRTFIGTVGGSKSNKTSGGSDSGCWAVTSDEGLQEVLSPVVLSDMSTQLSGSSSESVVMICLMNVS